MNKRKIAADLGESPQLKDTTKTEVLFNKINYFYKFIKAIIEDIAGRISETYIIPAQGLANGDEIDSSFSSI